MKPARRRKGDGTVIRTGASFRARKRILGRDHYGPRRKTESQAARDLKNLGPAHHAGRAPELRLWAYECMAGSYGKSIAVTTFNTNEAIRRIRLTEHPIARLRLDQITRRHCQEFIDDQALFLVKYDVKTGRSERIKGEPSAAYIHRIAGFLRRLFQLAIDEGAGWIETNPAARLRMPTVYERQNRTLTPQEATRLMNPTGRLEDMLKVYMLTGLRRAELCRLEWKHLTRHGLYAPGTKTRGSRIEIPIDEEVREVLERQPKRGATIFSTAEGKPLNPKHITREFVLWKSRHGFPRELRLQDLRGSYGCLLIEQGHDIRTVMELMRHSDAKTTLKSYLRGKRETKESAVRLVARTLRQAADAAQLEQLVGAQAPPLAAPADLLEALANLRSMGAQAERMETGYRVVVAPGMDPLMLSADELVQKFGPREAEIIRLPAAGQQ